MSTIKGRYLASLLSEQLGWTKAIEEACSKITRHASTYDRLAVEECNGPRWINSPQATPQRILKWQDDLDAKQQNIAHHLEKVVSLLPETDNGPIRLVLSGDPRGFVVRLAVPTSDGYYRGIGIDQDGAHRGAYVGDLV